MRSDDNSTGRCAHDVSFVTAVKAAEVRRAAVDFLAEAQEHRSRKPATTEA